MTNLKRWRKVDKIGDRVAPGGEILPGGLRFRTSGADQMTIPQDMREAILREVMEGASLRQACVKLGATRSEVYVDLAEDQAFSDQYARATSIRADDQFDEMFEIADGAGDPQRDRLRVDTRKWALARMNPRKYGEKVQIGGADDLPPVATLDATKLSSTALREIMAATSATAEPDEG